MKFEMIFIPRTETSEGVRTLSKNRKGLTGVHCFNATVNYRGVHAGFGYFRFTLGA